MYSCDIDIDVIGGMLKEAHVITAIGGDDSKTTEFVPYQDVSIVVD
jgi:hypothetical protein